MPRFIAIGFLLTLEDPHRFGKSRDVGGYLGLQPGRRNSGESEPQLHISKEGDPYLRTLLVQGAQHILGPFGIDCDATLGIETGGAWRKKRQEASHRGHGKKAGGVAASSVGERRSVRALAQQQPNDSCGSCVKQTAKAKSKSFQQEERQKPKAEFR
jgi:hypothetical protein